MVALATCPVRELRAALGISQERLAKLAGISRHSVVRAEQGRIPSPLVQHAIHRLARRYEKRIRREVNVPIHRVNIRRMQLCLGKPGPQWKRWSGQQRACYYSYRARYMKMMAEQQMARAIILPGRSF